MALSPFLGLAVAYDMKGAALCGCALAAASDWADGYIAKTFDQRSHLGSLIDPLADKFVIGALTLGLTYQSVIPTPLCALIVGRDLSLVAGAFYLRLRSLPPGVAFFDYSHSSMFAVQPSNISKVLLTIYHDNTPLHMLTA
jgi:cardiolipin synthase (CMP-forming)